MVVLEWAFLLGFWFSLGLFFFFFFLALWVLVWFLKKWFIASSQESQVKFWP